MEFLKVVFVLVFLSVSLFALGVPAQANEVELAYQEQAKFVAEKLKNDEVAGYKAALTAEAQMKRFGATDPASSVLFKSGHLTGSPVIELRKGVMLETEIGYRTSKLIDKNIKDVEELKGYIAEVFPAIEVPIVDFPDLSKVVAKDLVATNIGSWKFITGEPAPITTDLNAIKVTLTHDGQIYNEGNGSDALGDQWKAVLWLVNNVVSHGGKIEKGSVLISGAMGRMLPAKPGKYEADFGDFGKISFEVK